MGNIYTVGPNEALVVSGMYIITLFSFCEVKLQLIYKVFWIPLHSKSRLAFSRCQLLASYFSSKPSRQLHVKVNNRNTRQGVKYAQS